MTPDGDSIGLLIEVALRGRQGRPASDSVRRALAPDPDGLHDLEVVEAWLA